jgi:hypothetical protein
LKKAYTYIGDDGKSHFEAKEYFNKREEVQTAVGPQFISASLKYLSGSEQLVNAVKFLTGYSRKQRIEDYIDENDGKKKQRVIYDWKAVWEDKDSVFRENPEVAKEYFNKKALQYVTDQTPSQILGMRSDYYAPMLEHLSMAYENSKMEGWADEEILEHEEYIKELAEIQTRYGDLPPEKAREMREKDTKKLKDKMAGIEFRKLLDSKGKLNQIYRTRRSGAANNAKDWMRNWLDLDNDTAVSLKLDEDRRREKEELEKAKQAKRQQQGGGDSPVEDENRVYSDVDIAGFVSHVEDMWHDLRSEDDDVSYEESLDYVKKTLSQESYIVKKYEEFRKDDPYADSHMLKEFLVDLLNDPKNY